LRRSTLFFLFFLLPPAILPQALWADPVFGDWWTEDREAIIRLSQDGDSVSGKIVWLAEPNHPESHERAGEPVIDEHNPEEEAQSRPVLGLEILWGFDHHSEGEWRDGSIYDPENGRSYRARLRMDGEDELRLRGYVGRPIFGRSSQWDRVDNDWPEDGEYYRNLEKDDT